MAKKARAKSIEDISRQLGRLYSLERDKVNFPRYIPAVNNVASRYLQNIRNKINFTAAAEIIQRLPREPTRADYERAEAEENRLLNTKVPRSVYMELNAG